MRLLHTSDWHLGQDFYKFDRSFEHRRFLDGVVQTLVDEKIDVLLIAGDVFDVSNPPAAAQRMFFEFLADAKRRVPHLQTVVIAGNHDSGARLEAPAELLRNFAVTVVGRVVSTAQGIVSGEAFLVPLFAHKQGVPDAGSPAAVCIALPFLKNADVQWSDQNCPYPEAVVRCYRQAITAARAQFGDAIPLIAMGHMHARGGQNSKDSERPIIIGGEESVPLAELADEFSYIALGHLHLAQDVGGHPHIRYSGSPLPMSFSEINYTHQMVVVELNVDKKISLKPFPIARPVEFIRCPSRPLEIDEVLNELSALALPPLSEAQYPYLEVPVRLSGPVPELRSQIETALKNKCIRLVKVSPHRPEGVENSPAEKRDRPIGLDSLRSLDPLTVMSDLHQRKYQSKPDDDLLKAFREVLIDVSTGHAE
jgi:exonuclease SbcD